MSTIACPYCYHRFQPANLRFQCTGRAAPGRTRCTRSVDEERLKLTGYAEASWPTFPPPPSRLRLPRRRAACPDCGTDTGIRACPVCRTPLPANFADSRSPLIGMVGGKNSGKTVYTTVLVHELRHRVRRRFDADVSFAGEQAGARTAAWLENYEHALFDDNALFEPTTGSADGSRVPLVVQWRQPHRSLGREVHSTTTLSFYDAAGEDMTTQEFVNRQAYLGAADGLVVLLDPFQLPGTRDRIAVPEAGMRDTEPPLSVLGRLTELLRATGGVGVRRRIPVPVAVVFSKIDAFYGMLGEGHPLLRAPSAGAHYDEAAGRDTDEHLRAMLADLGADDIDAHLRAHYKSYRYFAVSSLGAEPDYDGKRIDPGGVRPFRVDEPLLWLLGLFRIVERSG
ncbi:zinc ribbon domain-containing protein [Saccharopolyspora erythraea]|uniref:TRAFAC clade GTPase domain-containing protein n=1 Tax=Saccharopolyspora erythraea TaxID=1836 RepID=UPI001BAB12BD|nr:zinc ribbon domain-containing protein [Saccharopolyspora erythraea]QUH03377.1 zinc ribbon domain-containing protein [Saccharopolyspora erythraea]